MPTYTFRHKTTHAEEVHVLSMSDREKFLEDNPHLEQIIVSAPGFGDPIRMGHVKPARGFRDVLKRIKKKHPGSTINDF